MIWIRRIIHKHNPDSVFVYSKFYAAIVALAIVGLRCNLFISERSSPLFKWKGIIKAFNWVAFFLNSPKGVIAQTNIAKEYQTNHYSRKTKIKVIPNPLREVLLHTGIKRQKQILAVGRLGDYLKGFDRLIDAFALLKNQDWELIIAGGYEDGEYLKKQAAKLDIFARIQFLGKVKDIDRIYAQASIFVIPSRSEGFPNALCEAMAAGLPCISFDFIAGPRDIITNNHDGIIVEDGNIDALANKIDSLIENESERKRLGRNALNIRERLDAKKISREYLKFILS